MRVVCNSSVLIALARICRLDLLKNLFGEVYVPEAVFREVVVEGKTKKEVFKISGAKWINKIGVRDARLAMFYKQFVDEGEAECLVLSLEMEDCLLIVDDKDARRFAEHLNLKYIGTLGVLVLAKKKGLLKSIRNLIYELRERGFYLGDDVIKMVLRETKENKI